MHDRGPGHTSSSSSRRRGQHRVPPGVPSYRPMRSPLVSMGPSLAEEQRRHHSIRHGVLVVAGLVCIAVALTLLVVWLGREVVAGDATPLPTSRALSLPVGRPVPQTLARVAATGSEPSLRLQLPIRRLAITGIGYDHVGDHKVLVLNPEGSRANTSFGQRMFRRFLSTRQPTDLRFFQLAEAGEPNIVNVGAAPGTDLYAPISGTVVAIADNVIDDEAEGVVVQLQPLGDAETVVLLRNIDADAELAVGQTVSEGVTRIGYVRDMTNQSTPSPLARYTHDDGSNVELSVRQLRLDVS